MHRVFLSFRLAVYFGFYLVFASGATFGKTLIGVSMPTQYPCQSFIMKTNRIIDEYMDYIKCSLLLLCVHCMQILFRTKVISTASKFVFVSILLNGHFYHIIGGRWKTCMFVKTKIGVIISEQ